MKCKINITTRFQFGKLVPRQHGRLRYYKMPVNFCIFLSNFSLNPIIVEIFNYLKLSTPKKKQPIFPKNPYKISTNPEKTQKPRS
jgi:hypothetical protein